MQYNSHCCYSSVRLQLISLRSFYHTTGCINVNYIQSYTIHYIQRKCLQHICYNLSRRVYMNTQHCFYSTNFAFLRLISDKLIDLTNVSYQHDAHLFEFCLNSKKSLFDLVEVALFRVFTALVFTNKKSALCHTAYVITTFWPRQEFHQLSFLLPN